eukprot:355371_1
MRRGLHSQMFRQTKTWVRPTEEEHKAKKKEGGGSGSDGGKDGDGDGTKEVSSDEADADNLIAISIFRILYCSIFIFQFQYGLLKNHLSSLNRSLHLDPSHTSEHAHYLKKVAFRE